MVQRRDERRNHVPLDKRRRGASQLGVPCRGSGSCARPHARACVGDPEKRRAVVAGGVAKRLHRVGVHQSHSEEWVVEVFRWNNLGSTDNFR